MKKVSETEAELGDPALDELLTPYLHQQLVDEIELLDALPRSLIWTRCCAVS